MFAVFLPPHALEGTRVPVLYWLSGLTCTDENFMQKAGTQRLAAELGLALVAPDTSPRGEKVPADPEGSWDFGHGAGFYVDASQAPWSRHYRIHSYVTRELPDLVEAQLPISTRRGISGHSMDGAWRPGGCHAPSGALFLCLCLGSNRQSRPQPLVQKAFGYLLGTDTQTWQA